MLLKILASYLPFSKYRDAQRIANWFWCPSEYGLSLIINETTDADLKDSRQAISCEVFFEVIEDDQKNRLGSFGIIRSIKKHVSLGRCTSSLALVASAWANTFCSGLSSERGNLVSNKLFWKLPASYR